MAQRNQEGTISVVCEHAVKAIFAKDQKNFYALSKGNQYIREGLSLYEAETMF